jgi:glutathione S-transferase
MIELVQFPWSPFCIVQRRILEFSAAPFKLTQIPSTDRSLVWRMTKQRYYQVPVLRDGKNVLFEVDDNSQVLAKYVDEELNLGLFPREWEGVQSLLWRYLENDVEGACFRLNDIYWQEFVPKAESLPYLRHKERKFGRGCIDQWRSQQKQLLQQLTAALLPFEEMLLYKEYLLGPQPRFVDFDLFGMLGNFLYSGHYSLPSAHNRLKAWFKKMSTLKLPDADLDVPF